MCSVNRIPVRLAWTAASLLALALLAFSPCRARADFEFTGSASSSDGPVSAEAYFTLQNGQITVYVANLNQAVAGQGQAISQISFSVTAPPDTSLSLASVAGTLTTLQSNGSFSTPTYTSDTATLDSKTGLYTADNWAASSTAGVTDFTIKNPLDMIIGPNASFTGNGNNGTNFNPYFQTTATAAFNTAPTAAQVQNGYAVKFVLNAPGATGASTISNVVFNFGTSPNEHTANGSVPSGGPNGNPGGSLVPAPSSLILLGVGALGLLGFAGVRRFRQVPAAA